MKSRKHFTVLVLLAANTIWAVDLPSSAGQLAPMTKWTSADGRTILARELRLEGENIVLERSDGSVFSVPLSRLSPESKAMAKRNVPAPVESKKGGGTQMQPVQPPASANKENPPQTPQPTESPASINNENSPPTPPVALTQAPVIQQPQSFTATWRNERSTLARIALVSLLLMLASSFGGLITRLVVAASVIAVIPVDSWFPSGSSRLTQFTACFAALSCLPSIFQIGSSMRLLLASAVLFGLPTLLVSLYLFGSPWTLAAADAAVGFVLLPVGIIRLLLRMEIIKPPHESTVVQAGFTPTPSVPHESVPTPWERRSIGSGAPDYPRRSEMRRPPDPPDWR